MRWAEHVESTAEMRNALKILFVKHEVKRPPDGHRSRWEEGIKIDLKEIVCERVDWIQLDQDVVQWWAFVNTVMNIQFPERRGIS
jgi:hypothetical protein